MNQSRCLDWSIAEAILDTLDLRSPRDRDAAAMRDALLDQLPTDPWDDFVVELQEEMWEGITRLCPQVTYKPLIADCEYRVPKEIREL